MDDCSCNFSTSDAPPPKDDADGSSGPETTGISFDPTLNEGQSSQPVGVPTDPSAMDIDMDTPATLGGQPPDESTADFGFQPSFTAFTSSEPINVDLDVLPQIPGLFRLLDLYLERGSNDNCEFTI